MQVADRASLEFSVNWEGRSALHRDRYFAGKVDPACDIFPGDMGRHVAVLNEGECYKQGFEAGVLVPPFESSKIIEFKASQFARLHEGKTIVPRLGRFYPKGFAWSALKCYSENLDPFRLIEIDNGALTADTNHPLASYPLTLEAIYLKKLGTVQDYGGSCNDISEMIMNGGPGMQMPYPGIATDFYFEYPFRRKNEDEDTLFYRTPRFVNHLDRKAVDQVKSIYSRLLRSDSKILDLMSSWISYLPDTLENYESIGLGLNGEELKANRQLSGFVLQDLNRSHELPFEDNEFDSVVCTASIEYLIKPIQVIGEVARITRPGGLFISTFSDRWFPGKEIQPWSDMHPFERQGLVLDYYLKTDAFEDLHTESIRGLPRPLDDIHIQETVISDPIFAVWGKVKA
ncbi:MAG: hypothetical protein AVO38_10815 [delta proteobacterium ML8_D]|nr:MAG: hypothetical protein AVO38_10815 [delta proteobacterium ML8_D]